MKDTFKRLQLMYYTASGFSVIPLVPDSKKPAVPWADYQQRRPTGDEMHNWFSDGPDYNIGIITGEVSDNLIVLDFDNPEVWGEFAHAHRELLLTRIVRTAGRQLPHLYFYAPTGADMSSLKAPGIDL